MKYRHAFILFILIYIIFFAPVIFRGEVIYPHNNAVATAEPFTPEPAHISNNKFSDESNVFIPEINFLLNGRHRAWLGTWNPDTELGRPAPLLGGLSKAYLPSNILSFFTQDPFLFYTLTILLTVFLTGMFLFLLLKSLDLHPLACLIAAMGVSFGVYFTYWFTFNIILSSFCWTMGLMWLSRRFIQRASLPLALGLAFVSYSLFMMGYPQMILLNLYIVVAFTLVLLWKKECGVKKKVFIAVMLIGAALFGLLMTAPAYMDLLETAGRSARLGAGNDFFLNDFPKIDSFGVFLVFLNSVFDAFVFGNPIKPDYVFPFSWPSLTPLYSALFLFTFINGLWRRLWPWHVFILLCTVGTVSSGAYLFAVRHMGFNMSFIFLLAGMIIPAGILTGFSADYLIRIDKGGEYLKKAVVFLSLLPLVIIFFMYTKKITAIVDVRYLIFNLIIITIFYTLSIIRSKTLKTWGLLALALLTVFVYGRNLRLIRPEGSIHTTSNLIEFVKAQTADGTRFAFVGFKNIIPANQESLFGVRSIHSFDSLSSREYQGLVKKLSRVGTVNYGRFFRYITDGSRLGSADFSYTGIGLYISTQELLHPALVKIAQWRQYRFYKPLNQPILQAQVVDYELKKGAALLSGRLEGHELFPARRLDNYTDYKTYSLAPFSRPTLLFISEQYNPRWKARSGSGPLRTVLVNDFYEGVIIPPGIAEVTLEFRPLVLWMWVPQVIFIIFGGVLAVRYFIVRKKIVRRGSEA